MSRAEQRHPSKGRTITVWLMIVVASLLAIGSATSTWLKRQALDTDSWVKASDEVLATPAVQHALAAYVVDQLYANVDVAAAFEERLPTDFKNLSGPISAALRTPAQQGVERLLAAPKAQELWSQVNRRAHAALVRVLENKTRVGSTEGGTVSLDLGQLVRELGQELGIPSSLLDKLPADAGQIVLVNSSQLKMAQDIVRTVKVLSVLLLLAVVGLYAGAAYVAIDRRRTIRNIGWAVVLSALVLLGVRRGVNNYVISLVNSNQYQDAARATLVIWTQLLRDLAIAGLWYGLVVVAWAFVAGPTRVGTAVRRTLAPALNASLGAVLCWAGGLFLLLTLWAPTPAFDFGLRWLLLGVLYAAGIATLRVRTMDEFADVHFSDLAAGITRTYHRATGKAEPETAPAAVQTPAVAMTPTVDLAAIERLHQLHREGAISDAEYETAKEAVLGGVKVRG